MAETYFCSRSDYLIYAFGVTGCLLANVACVLSLLPVLLPSAQRSNPPLGLYRARSVSAKRVLGLFIPFCFRCYCESITRHLGDRNCFVQQFCRRELSLLSPVGHHRCRVADGGKL